MGTGGLLESEEEEEEGGTEEGWPLQGVEVSFLGNGLCPARSGPGLSGKAGPRWTNSHEHQGLPRCSPVPFCGPQSSSCSREPGRGTPKASCSWAPYFLPCLSEPQVSPLGTGQAQLCAACVLGARVREVRSEKASCPSVKEQKGGTKGPIFLGMLGAPFVPRGKEGGGVSQA